MKMRKIKGIIEKAKDTIRVIASTSNEDRQGESIDQSGWILERFKENPVILWSHNALALPVAKAENIGIEDGKLKADIRFAKHAFAQDLKKLVEDGFVNTTSVGFMPKAFADDDETKIISAELLEISFVSVPANAEAQVERQYKSFMEKLKTIEASENPQKAMEDMDVEEPENPKEKEGRVISEKNRSKMRLAIDSMEQATDALRELIQTTTPPEKAERPKGRVENPVSKKPKVSSHVKALRLIARATEVAILDQKERGGGNK